MFLPYTGSGDNCYADSLSMALGPDSPGPGAIDVLTGAPFGMQLHAGTTPFFDPAGWDCEIGLDAAVAALGWTCVKEAGGTREEAAARLRGASPEAPLLVGPVEMGLLTHVPGRGSAWGADHYVVVFGVEDELVRFHDPKGYAFASLPVERFVDAWRTDSLLYGESFTSRRAFERTADVPVVQALRAALPHFAEWLRGGHGHPVEAGNLANAEAAEGLAAMWEAGLAERTVQDLAFMVPAGARRAGAAGACLAAAGADEASAIAARQARLV
ncbi:hypothetical protein, partial [Glycomyces dulcitolivorans]|uniref:hypothetical protein n=1 Tax=Glycomyces dulcitolivorans TaxID=2200759 RepID=UPI000DD33531